MREHTLFEAGGGNANANGGDSGGDSDGNVPGTTAPAWTEQSCVAALSQGKVGDSCVGTFSCTAFSQCQVTAACTNGELALKQVCDTTGATCTGDADCGSGRICDAYACRDCPLEACPDSWSSIVRNGCSVCVPPSHCKAGTGDPACAEGQVCAAGLTCLAGCKDDPACCFGNQCTLPACPTLEGADCVTVGCPAGSTCQVVGDAVGCKCDEQIGKWTCESPPVNVCVPR